MKLFLTILSILLIYFLDCSSSSNCHDKTQCDECIAIYGCTWCKDLSYPKDNPRCIPTKAPGNTCPGTERVAVQSSAPTVTKNQPISLSMRIQPQEASIRLAVGQESKVNLIYNDNTDKQLDLYYIMDLSATMEDDRNTVSRQAQDLVRALQQITSDVKLGFGAFIDKPVLPFVSSSQLRDDDLKYTIPYGFRNWLRLTSDTSSFSSAVKNAKISRNLDEPEGTLDALMQAVVCTNEIGWRNSSQKLIVVATDGPFHIAGDGKLGGVIRPNDMKCHLDSKGRYTHSTYLDYPSIGEMNAAILEHKVYVIFAISTQGGNNDVFKVYDELQKHISESTATELNTDSSNIVQTIKKKYEEISETVRLTIAEKPDFVDVNVQAKCPRSKNVYFKSDTCTGVKKGESIEFQIGLTLKECPDPAKIKTSSNQIVVTFFKLTTRERLVIKMNYECSCECSKQYNFNVADLRSHCNGPEAAQHISCGICKCQENRYGDQCQCTRGGDDDNQDKSKCIQFDGIRNVTCSNKGECKCGQCECERDKNGLVMYSGNLCQYSTENCKNPSNPGRLCSERGNCEEGECRVCDEGYDGKYCQCEKSKKQQCIEPGKSLSSLCNGHGECDCDNNYQCKCTPGYDGVYCDVCKSNCPDKEKLGSRCGDPFLQKCARCLIKLEIQPDSKLEQECKELCDLKNMKKVSTSTSVKEDVSELYPLKVPNKAVLSEKTGSTCPITFNSTCQTEFKYDYLRSSQGQVYLRLYYTKDGLICNPEPPLVLIIFGVILSVLIAGILALLIWKLATHLHDTREYKRFEKESGRARWGQAENPLYEKPMTEFANPAYRG